MMLKWSSGAINSECKVFIHSATNNQRKAKPYTTDMETRQETIDYHQSLHTTLTLRFLKTNLYIEIETFNFSFKYTNSDKKSRIILLSILVAAGVVNKVAV